MVVVSTNTAQGGVSWHVAGGGNWVGREAGKLGRDGRGLGGRVSGGWVHPMGPTGSVCSTSPARHSRAGPEAHGGS